MPDFHTMVSFELLLRAAAVSFNFCFISAMLDVFFMLIFRTTVDAVLVLSSVGSVWVGSVAGPFSVFCSMVVIFGEIRGG